MLLNSCIEQHADMTAPMFVVDELPYSMYIMRWVGASKSDPEQIIQHARGELTVVTQYDHRYT